MKATMNHLELIKAICVDPNYQRNSALGLSMNQVDAILPSLFDADDAERVHGFWGLTGETLGAVWKAVLARGECDLDLWLEKIESECSFAMTEDTGLDFSTATSSFFGDLESPGTTALDTELEGRLRDFIKHNRKQLRDAGPELAEAIERFTSAYVVCYQEIEWAAEADDAKRATIRGALAECYAAQARLRAVVVDVWITMQLKRRS